MPYSTTDPTKYADSAYMIALAASVARGGGPYEETCESAGAVHSFSQRFYSFRKAVTHRYEALERKRLAARRHADSKAKGPSDWTDLDHTQHKRYEDWLHFLEAVTIYKPDGKNSTRFVMRLTSDTNYETQAGLSFIEQNAENLPPELREVFDPSYVDPSKPMPKYMRDALADPSPPE